MNKSNAVAIFGGVKKLADALGIKRQAVYQWNDALTQRQTDEIVGAALRLKFQTMEDVEQLIKASK
jgi:UTP--glucose-1-phosphate uridylyltransferase